MTTVQDILHAAQALPSTDRAQLIEALWDTLSPDDWPRPSDDWITEAQRRSTALDAGEMAVSPWTEARKRVRREAGLDG